LQEFHHDITFKKGEISMLSSNPAVFKYWYNHRLPAIKTDENGRNLKAGIYLGSFIKKIDEISKKTLPLFQSQFCANQSLHILEHDKDCQHLYSLSFNQHDTHVFIQWVINNINDVHNFIEYYKSSCKKLIFESKKLKNRIQLPLANYHQNELLIANLVESPPEIMHAETQKSIYLSHQQNICLSLLFKGLTAKQIADKMALSFRTVQHYLERIRKTLGCKTTKELILKYSGQFN